MEIGGICDDEMFVNTFPDGLMNFPVLCPPDLFPAKLPTPELELPAKRAKKDGTAAARASQNYRKRKKEASEELANKNNVLSMEIISLKARNDAMETQVWKMVEELQTTYRTLKDERLRIVTFELEIQRLRQLVGDH